MSTRQIFDEFWQLSNNGKRGAIDVNISTGELVIRSTKSRDGVCGNGAPPISYTDDWARIIECNGSVITPGSSL